MKLPEQFYVSPGQAAYDAYVGYPENLRLEAATEAEAHAAGIAQTAGRVVMSALPEASRVA